ncbi:hypothetical protein ElyMa_000293100 [Elysia marginata]|uniref:Uncharacterized protein n=1 Tax=Elysia marginata TaxID=1093978 RepID=A0AAV4F7S6_9GAST|nr:hypothetical protein ElyMa_000293100 [Elysia marginata]
MVVPTSAVRLVVADQLSDVAGHLLTNGRALVWSEHGVNQSQYDSVQTRTVRLKTSAGLTSGDDVSSHGLVHGGDDVGVEGWVEDRYSMHWMQGRVQGWVEGWVEGRMDHTVCPWPGEADYAVLSQTLTALRVEQRA